MSSANHTLFFDAARAESYDRQFEVLHPIKDSLHLLVRGAFGHLPAASRILVVGAGTGAEVRFLAPLFPDWRFTLVDPSAAMLNVARRYAEAGSYVDRCEFHVGVVADLGRETYDAATSVLVSHFLTDADERRGYFAEISARLRQGGPLFNADLSAFRDEPAFEPIMDLWQRLRQLQATPGGPVDDGSAFRAAFGRDVAVHPPDEVASMIADAGFNSPALCYQFSLIRAWLAVKS